MRAGEVAMGDMLTLAAKHPDAYGFRAEDTFQKATLGDPVPVYVVPEAKRASYHSGQPLKPYLKSANRWMFPVMCGNYICCMVEVKFDGHEYVSGTSSKSLAMAWNKIVEKWPAGEGFHPEIVVNPAVPGYYFTVPELPLPNVTDTVQMTYFNPDVSPADVILASWR